MNRQEAEKVRERFEKVRHRLARAVFRTGLILAKRYPNDQDAMKAAMRRALPKIMMRAMKLGWIPKEKPLHFTLKNTITPETQSNPITQRPPDASL